MDYVLKPVREERLWRAVDRLVSRMKASERLTSSSDHPELAGPGKARAVRVQCFGGLELLIDGRTVRWPTRKSSELFAYLLHNNGKYVSKDRIVDDLWPDQGYENALVNLHTAVYRTRLALAESGGRLSIDYENGKYRLRMTDVSCDLQEFEGALEQSGIYPDKAIPLLQQALRAYTGDYLEEQSYIWCVDFQESLRRKHVACLKGLASRHLSNGDADKAIPLLEILVAKTQYDPVAVDLLFTAYVALRDVDSMVAFYEKVHERQADKVGKNGLHLIEERFIEGYRRLTGRTLT